MSQHTDPASAEHHADAAPHGFDAEISRRPVYWTGLVLIGVALLAFAAIWALMRGMQKYDQAHAAQPSVLQEEIDRQRAQGPPEPRLQPDPNLDMRALRAEEDTLLSTYGWADRATGTVRIPIDQAMDLLAARGLGAKPAAAAPIVAATGPSGATAAAPPAEAHP